MLNEINAVLEPKSSLPKYHEDGPFEDPLIRCYNCGQICLTKKWVATGKCPKCENRRLRNILTMSDEEFVIARNWGVDPDFLALFEQVADE